MTTEFTYTSPAGDEYKAFHTGRLGYGLITLETEDNSISFDPSDADDIVNLIQSAVKGEWVKETEVFTCGALTHPGSMYVDPTPPEYCETPVEHEGDVCSKHEPPDEPDWDSIRKDRDYD